jgi:hypothetical protein
LAKELNIFSSEMASDNVVTCPEFSRVTAINMVRDFESELTTSFTASTSTYRYAVSGAMPAGQAGTHNPGPQTQARQLIITY